MSNKTELSIEATIKVAADSIELLRKPDVYRVIECAIEAGLANKDQSGFARQVASYIKEQRSDLADEVLDVCEELGV